MSRILGTKMLRDLWRARWQYGAVALMVVLGVVFLIASYSTYENLDGSYKNSYVRTEFEDFGMYFHAAPERVADRLTAIRGIRAVEGRLVEDVTIRLGAESDRKLIGRLISVPIGRTSRVDQLKLVAGRLPMSKTERSVLVEATFAEHNRVQPGDIIRVERGTGHVLLRVSGIVQSPEYLYVVRSRQELMPMPDTFGVLFLSKDVLGPLLGMAGQINEVRATVVDPERLDTVMRASRDLLRVYRPDPPIPRSEQPSYQMLQQDVHGFRSYAVLFPLLFLGAAAATVYTMLLRTVYQQRPVIGLMRSLGFAKAQIVWHYLQSALAVGLLASLIGAAGGLWASSSLSHFYMRQLQVPYQQIEPRWGAVVAGLLVGVLTCAAAGFFPALASSKIEPAEAMRPATPSFGRGSAMLDRLVPRLEVLWRMPLRNVFRQPRRTFSTLFGMVAGMALMITARGLLDSTDAALNDLVSGSYRYDLRVDFIKRESSGLMNRIRSWPGVVRAEPTLEVPVEMRHGSQTYQSLVSGVTPGSSVLTLKDGAGSRIDVRAEGAIFGSTLKKRLRLERGDLVQITLPKQFAAEQPTPRYVRVADFNAEAMATQAYLPIDEVRKLFRKDLELPPDAIGAAQVVIDPRYERDLRSRLLRLPNAAAVTSIPEIRRMVQTMMTAMNAFVWIMELFGMSLAFAMIFNMITVNVLERVPEVATLRTIGVSRAQIALAITMENAIVALLGIAIGVPGGNWFVQMFWQAAQTEEQQDLFTFNVSISNETFLIASVSILLVTLLSQLPALLMVSRLDLAQATKERST